MKATFQWGIALATVLAVTGCQTVPYQGQARDVKRKPGVEGIISVPLDPRTEDRAKAEEKMRSNCGQLAVKVLEEGEIVVGQETHTSGRETERKSEQRKVGSLFGVPVMSGDQAGTDTSSSSVTKSVKEWQIAYKCESETKKTR